MRGSTGNPSYAILAEGQFSVHSSKTACCMIRCRPEQVVAVIDRQQAGRTAGEVLGFGGAIPVVADLESALPHRPNRLLIGIAPPGGKLPPSWRRTLLAALDAGLDLYSGLHTFLRDDSELVRRAELHGARLVDLRAVPEDLGTPTGERESLSVPIVLAVGTDCNVGKMTAMWELREQARAAGRRYSFVATGQTGLLVEGERGIAIDRVIADYLAGCAERLVVSGARDAQLVLVEGQGSLVHPFYSGVTLGLLHGTQPDGMILCHQAGRTRVRHAEHLALPPIARFVEIYEEAAAWLRPARVLGIGLATHLLEEDAALREIERCRDACGLPVEDPVRWPSGALLAACEGLREEMEA